MDYLFTARPTAVNLGNATRRLSKVLEQQDLAAEELAKKFVAEGKLIADEDVGRNKEMAKWGAEWLVQQVGDQIPEGGLNVMTVCNTGSLATSGKSLIVAAEENFIWCFRIRNRSGAYNPSARDWQAEEGLLYAIHAVSSGIPQTEGSTLR